MRPARRQLARTLAAPAATERGRFLILSFYPEPCSIEQHLPFLFIPFAAGWQFLSLALSALFFVRSRLHRRYNCWVLHNVKSAYRATIFSRIANRGKPFRLPVRCDGQQPCALNNFSEFLQRSSSTGCLMAGKAKYGRLATA